MSEELIINYDPDTNRVRVAEYFMGTELQCRCCKKLLLVSRLLIALDKTRDKFGPIIPTSAVRCPAYQKKLYEKINSDRKNRGLQPVKAPRVGEHVKGLAVDTGSIVVPGAQDSDMENEFLEILFSLGWRGIGIQKTVRNDVGMIIQYGWTHLDVRPGARVIWRYGIGAR